MSSLCHQGSLNTWWMVAGVAISLQYHGRHNEVTPKNNDEPVLTSKSTAYTVRKSETREPRLLAQCRVICVCLRTPPQSFQDGTVSFFAHVSHRRS
jgi:hypothetical protein